MILRLFTNYVIQMAPLLFKHSRLDTTNSRAFRVLELLPSRGLQAPIRCELHHRILGDTIQYEAVSYAWGEPNPQTNIYINGSTVLGVTKNCYEALFTCDRDSIGGCYGSTQYASIRIEMMIVRESGTIK